MTRTGLLIVVAALLASAVGAPAVGATEAAQFPMTVENCGREVTIPEPPERVLVIGADAATLVWAAGAADQITTYASFEGGILGPAEDALRAVPQALPVDNLSKEVIIGQQPDVVITYGLGRTGTTPEELAEAGIQTLFVSGYCLGEGGPQSEGAFGAFEGIFADIELYGRLFGTQEQAAKTVADLRERVAAVEELQIAPEGSDVAILDVSGGEGVLGAYGNRSMADAQMQKLGLENVFSDVDEFYFEPSVEDLIARDPDVLIALFCCGFDSADAMDRLRMASELNDVTAVRQGNIVVLNYQYSGSGYLAVEGLEILADQLAALQ